MRFDTCPCSEKMFAAFGADWTCEYVTSVLNLKRMFDVCRQRPKCTFGYLLLGWKKSKHTYLGSSDDEAAAPARSPVPEVLLLEDAAIDAQVTARLAGFFRQTFQPAESNRRLATRHWTNYGNW